MAAKGLVLITGGSGYLGSYCIVEALNQGYRVRTTIRSLKRKEDVKQMLHKGGIPTAKTESVEFVEADLLSDQGWDNACKDCTYVLHVASPLLTEVPKDPDDVIKPAKEGTLRVLNAAKAAGCVKRVVLTSSISAIAYGHGDQGWKPYTESDWTDLSATRTAPYHISKTLAERAAWDYMASNDGSMELTVINPVGIFGPILSKDYAVSMEIIGRLLNGELPGCLKLYISVVDVRDVAELHLRAMLHPKANGQRFIAVADDKTMIMRDMALRLKKVLGPEKTKKVPTREMPNFVIQIASWFDKPLGLVVMELGIIKNATNGKAKEMLGWRPRSADETLREAGESLIEFGLVK